MVSSLFGRRLCVLCLVQQAIARLVPSGAGALRALFSSCQDSHHHPLSGNCPAGSRAPAPRGDFIALSLRTSSAACPISQVRDSATLGNAAVALGQTTQYEFDSRKATANGRTSRP